MLPETLIAPEAGSRIAANARGFSILLQGGSRIRLETNPRTRWRNATGMP